MKVVQILPKMNVGGVERGVLDLAKHFKDSDIQTIVVSGGGLLVEALETQGAQHHHLAVYKKSPFSLFLISHLKKFILKEKIDIVHARSRVPAWISFFASRNTKTHFITTAHGIYKSKFWSEAMGWGKFVICPSKLVARHMHTEYGVPEEKIVVINRWVDLEKFTFTPYEEKKQSNTIIAMGRISPTKGYEYLIEGFRRLVRSNPYLTLKIIGSADKSKMDYFNHLKSLVSRYALNYNVQFVEFREDIQNALKEARLLVAPSVIEESFGRVIVEAFACGVPVVATKVGGYNEIIKDGIDGLLVEPHNSDAIAEGINKLLNGPDLAASLAKAARKKTEELYTMDKALDETANVYKQTVSFNRILAIKLSSLGDLILSLPSLKAIKEHFPQSKLCLLTQKQYSSFLYDCPFIDEVITVGDDYKKMSNIFAIAKKLRRKSFDYIVDFQNSKASHLISYFSFGRYSFGYSIRLGWLLSKKIRVNKEDGPLQSQERILEFLGIRLKEKKLIFWDGKKSESSALVGTNFIGINVSASARWESKNLSIKTISNLMDMVEKNWPSFKIVLVGSKDSVERASQIEAQSNSHPINLCGKTTIAELPDVIRRMKLFITPDTATMHLACAIGIPTIAVFGPTSPVRHVVPSQGLRIIHKKELCKPCYRPTCPKKEKNICTIKITPQEIYQNLKEIMEKEDEQLNLGNN